MGGGLVTATFNPMLAGSVPASQRTAAMSWAEAAWVIAIGGGALLAGVPTILAHTMMISQVSADRALFLFCLACSLVATVLLVTVSDQPHASRDEPTPSTPATPVGHAWPHILKVTVFFTLQGAGLGLVVQLLPLWFTLRYHTNAEGIAPWFAAAQIVGLPFIIMLPAVARRIGVSTVILLTIALSTLFLAAMPFAPIMVLAALLFVARSGLVGMQWPAQHSFLQGTIHPRLRGTATSVAMGCSSVANALFPTAAGYFLDRGLLYWPPLLGVACYGAAAIWFRCTLYGTAMPEEIQVGDPPAVQRAELAV